MLSVGITTFKRRFGLFKILLENVKILDPDIEVNVTVNADYGKPLCDEYRRNILRHCADYKNVNVFIFPTMTSLSKMMNTLVINSSNEYNVIIQDDVIVTDKDFFDKIQYYLEKENEQCACIQSFSCFVVSKFLLNDIGYFDERFLALGIEDGDFLWRHIRKYKKWPGCWTGKVLTSSWELDSRKMENVDLLGDPTEERGSQCPKFNDAVFHMKYEPDSDPDGLAGWFSTPMKQISPDQKQYPYESFKLKYYSRLNEGDPL